MPSNTTIHDLADLINRLGCIHKARKAEFELSYYRKHKRLPEDALYIANVYRVKDDDKEIVELKEGA